ncbi:MAG: ATP-binding protein, partial [Myxococcota bacterium]
MNNPYRTDYPGQGPFYGREFEVTQLLRALRTGRKSIAAVMGGRGMGKTSLALRLEDRLRDDANIAVHLLRKPEADPHAFVAQLSGKFGRLIEPQLFTESIEEAVRAQDAERTVVLIDEVENLIIHPAGCKLLENLRIAWEALLGRLGIVVFGGSSLRQLLVSDVSPFLRSAQWLPLRGLDRTETAALVREPCQLDISDDMVDVLWEQTGGHPLLIQGVMERAMALGQPVTDQLLIAEFADAQTPKIFKTWWKNLKPRGQDIYRRLLAHGQPLGHDRRLAMLGNEPSPWIEVLETTGVARVHGGETLLRGEAFRAWYEREHAQQAARPETIDVLALDRVPTEQRHEFENTVVRTTARWSRDRIEYPVTALKSPPARGNDRLLPEQSFQIELLMALKQRDLLVEPEPLSVAGRTDLKIRWPEAPE